MDLSTKEKEKEGICICRDTLLALLDFLVEPLLPSRSSLRDSISLSQQESLAKQVHAVVVLYNYYHRKQHPGLTFLEFQSFCELAVDLKPSLNLYLSVTQKSDYSKHDDLDEDLSLTEKAIMNACDTSKTIDVSKDDPIIDGWPITKVAVFLVDSHKKNCILLHSSITQGVWSVIEKEVDVENQGSEALTEARSSNKDKKFTKRKDSPSLNELAYLAVKETCGVLRADLKILSNHLVYCTSKPKTTVQLYIMRCTKTTEDMNLVPIDDVMDSLEGPLVDNESVTPVVEYFHLLPFADKVLDWFKSGREMSEESSQHIEETKEDENCNNSPLSMEQPPKPSDNFEAVNNTCNGSHQKEELSISEFSKGQAEFRNAKSFYIDKESRPLNPKPEKRVENFTAFRRQENPPETKVYKKRSRSQKDNINKIPCNKTSNAPTEQCEATGSSNSREINEKRINNTCKDVHDQKLVLSVQETDQAALTRRAMDIKAKFSNDVEKASSNYQINDTAMSNDTGEQDGAIVPFDSDVEHPCKMQLNLTSKDPSVSSTVLNYLLKKRNQLSQQLRNIADEIAICEADIQTVLRGPEDPLAVKIETPVNDCNEISQYIANGAGEHTTVHYEYQDLSPVLKRRRLSEAILTLLGPCEELDGICNKNFWMLPNYVLSPSEGSFQATVNVKGIDFDCTSEGNKCKTPLEARNSAASNVLVKLRSLAAQS